MRTCLEKNKQQHTYTHTWSKNSKEAEIVKVTTGIKGTSVAKKGPLSDHTWLCYASYFLAMLINEHNHGVLVHVATPHKIRMASSSQVFDTPGQNHTC